MIFLHTNTHTHTMTVTVVVTFICFTNTLQLRGIRHLFRFQNNKIEATKFLDKMHDRKKYDLCEKWFSTNPEEQRLVLWLRENRFWFEFMTWQKNNDSCNGISHDGMFFGHLERPKNFVKGSASTFPTAGRTGTQLPYTNIIDVIKKKKKHRMEVSRGICSVKSLWLSQPLTTKSSAHIFSLCFNVHFILKMFVLTVSNLFDNLKRS